MLVFIHKDMKFKFNKKDIPETSKKILDEILNIPNNNKAKIVALSGDLGAGKTTLTQEIAKHLGIKEKIVSPTFVIMKIYDINPKSNYSSRFKRLIHIDAYRLDSHEELLKIGWGEIEKDKDNIIIIEWPERVSKYIPKLSLSVSLSHIDDENRYLEF
jgi:tRNA threonylcarbamoyladenosine biosynthesis protein TsaE